MPTYDYECASCGHRFELFEKITAGTRKKCLKCGKKTAQRMMGAGAGFVFKGAGFYTTDYARKGSGSDPETPKPEPANSEKKKTTRKTKSGENKKKS